MPHISAPVASANCGGRPRPGLECRSHRGEYELDIALRGELCGGSVRRLLERSNLGCVERVELGCERLRREVRRDDAAPVLSNKTSHLRRRTDRERKPPL